MTEDELLNLLGLVAQHLRQENDRATESERHRLPVQHIPDFRSRTNQILRLFVEDARGCNGPGSPQSVKPPQAEADPARAKHDARHEHRSNKWDPITGGSGADATCAPAGILDEGRSAIGMVSVIATTTERRTGSHGSTRHSASSARQ